MTARGIKKPGSKTLSVELRGKFKEDPSLQLYLR
jgi:GTP cyclohydrolase I